MGIDDRPSPVIPPRYIVEVTSFARYGNVTRLHELKGNSATEIVEQFEKLREAEESEHYDACLPGNVFRLAELETEHPE